MADTPNNFHLAINDQPFLFMGRLQADNLIHDLQQESHGGVTRTIRGHKCATVPDLHNEVAAVLQFPGYYGENWDAMVECLNNLEWLSGSWYLLHLCRPEAVLPDDDEDFRTFISILADAGRSWANPGVKGIPGQRPPRPFNIIISGDEADVSRTKRTVAALLQREI